MNTTSHPDFNNYIVKETDGTFHVRSEAILNDRDSFCSKGEGSLDFKGDRWLAEQVSEALHRAFSLGKLHTQNQIKKALGLMR